MEQEAEGGAGEAEGVQDMLLHCCMMSRSGWNGNRETEGTEERQNRLKDEYDSLQKGRQ